jgi:iron-sulfur cluster repair protein YtfE (RIC family)
MFRLFRYVLAIVPFYGMAHAFRPWICKGCAENESKASATKEKFMNTPTSSRELPVFQILKRDHREIAQLLQQIETVVGKETREVKNLLDQVNRALEAHTLVEEEVLYPLLTENESTESLALQAERAHDEMQDYLEELDELEPVHEEWQSIFGALKKCVEEHVREEENIIFPRMQQIFSDDYLKRAGEKIKEMKIKHEAA